jgi:hypothetical protein
MIVLYIILRALDEVTKEAISLNLIGLVFVMAIIFGIFTVFRLNIL